MFLGAGGALLVGIGSVVSMTGNNAGQVLSGSRMLFALAEHGELPAFFGRIHPRFRTPANSVVFTSAVALVLGLTGSFAAIAVVSALSRLVMYMGVSAATLRLRSPQFESVVKPATFVAPLGPVIPAMAIVVSIAIAVGATRAQMIGGFAALAVGALLFAIQSRSGSVRLQPDPGRVRLKADTTEIFLLARVEVSPAEVFPPLTTTPTRS